MSKRSQRLNSDAWIQMCPITLHTLLGITILGIYNKDVFLMASQCTFLDCKAGGNHHFREYVFYLNLPFPLKAPFEGLASLTFRFRPLKSAPSNAFFAFSASD